MNEQFRLNNFDLIRLLAALQVAVHHAAIHLEVPGWWWGATQVLPGVPIFFFVSGFLISKSFENSPHLFDYSRNRALRIFPALYACTGLALMSVWLSGYFTTVQVPGRTLIMWVIGQLTFVQFFNPSFMRGFGSGVLNGSLWTITVEIQFYCLVPVLYALLRWRTPTRRAETLGLLALIAVFLTTNQVFMSLNHSQTDELAVKLIKVTFAPWFYMFLVGVLAQRNFKVFHRALANRAFLVVPAFVGTAWAGSRFMGWNLGNQIHPALFLPLAAAIFSLAYTVPGLAERVLNRHDISYGLYIYHMPVINLMMFNGYMHQFVYVVVALLASLVLAAVSWFVVERPAIRLKRRSIHSLAASGAGVTP
ncbi:MAG: hypothetical protein RJB01_222 [Actinomycetota bacterium]